MVAQYKKYVFYLVIVLFLINIFNIGYRRQSALMQQRSLTRSENILADKIHQIHRDEESEHGEQGFNFSRMNLDQPGAHQDHQGLNNLENIDEYDGYDLMKVPPIQFNKNFKNPCWFEGDRLRCLPYVFVIGVKKCGTSDLFFRLSRHPDFAQTSNMDFETYVTKFNKAAEIIQATSHISADGTLMNSVKITGEGSPSNLHLNSHWQRLPGNENLTEPRYVILDYIRHFIPDAKLIITFRDPIDRLYSDYYHEYGTLMKKNDPGPAQFHEIVSRGVQLYRECFRARTIRSCVYDHTLYDQTKIQMQLGIYYIYWEELLRLFPRQQILVFHNEDMRDKERTVRTMYDFLGLPKLDAGEMADVVNAKESYQRRESFKAKGPMWNETYAILHDFYHPFNEKMVALTGDSKFLKPGS
ncbi:CHSTF-like protein [Mya arenaria]|uniref:CHSTF-like protein n=1 Tax=Mya arenaria TaxID=6604 RepID=A0ABY7DZT4_MYAAR|nr:CHSTF-like protein [Mya arenaria]